MADACRGGLVGESRYAGGGLDGCDALAGCADDLAGGFDGCKAGVLRGFKGAVGVDLGCAPGAKLRRVRVAWRLRDFRLRPAGGGLVRWSGS